MISNTMQGVFLTILVLTIAGAIAEGMARSKERYEARKRDRDSA